MALIHILKDRCPYCHEGLIFKNPNLFSYRSGEMNNDCPHCKARFMREPGYFWGSMYVSYALGTAEAFITYFICRIFGTGMFDMINLVAIILAIILLSPFNFRFSRVVWLYLFSGID
ncbi:MAG: DUF983 domain-containing protein [Sporocytophaga sp.]|uniref:hypothetical protein n=1 Tax=Sporocytophaga TaxID=1011 RepID=UPI000416C2F4|nr:MULTISPECIES: hypothetical protein [Sporocytophaga]MBO9701753.1 DUF983 domain-containing protein [Sporocytophaga sp.]